MAVEEAPIKEVFETPSDHFLAPELELGRVVMDNLGTTGPTGCGN